MKGVDDLVDFIHDCRVIADRRGEDDLRTVERINVRDEAVRLEIEVIRIISVVLEELETTRNVPVGLL